MLWEYRRVYSIIEGRKRRGVFLENGVTGVVVVFFVDVGRIKLCISLYGKI